MTEAEQLGADLRAARESRDLTLTAIEQQTRIRAYYLEALENGDFEVLPSPMQGRGFLRNYARVLGLDPELMAARFDAALAAGSRRRGRTPQAAPPIEVDRPRPPRTKTEPRRPNPSVGSGAETRGTPGGPPSGAGSESEPSTPGTGSGNLPGYVSPYPGGYQRPERAGRAARPERAVRRRIPPGAPPGADRAEVRQRRIRNTTLLTISILLVSLAALIILLVYALQGGIPGLGVPALTIAPTIDSAGTGATASATAAMAMTAMTETPARPSALPNPSTIQAQALGTQGTGAATAVNVQITIKERTQLRIYIDGKEDPIYSGSDAPGTVLQYSSKTSVRVECSDGAAIDVSVNGVPQGELGQRKQKIDRTFTLDSLNAPPPSVPSSLPPSIAPPTDAPAQPAQPTQTAAAAAPSQAAPVAIALSAQSTALSAQPTGSEAPAAAAAPASATLAPSPSNSPMPPSTPTPISTATPTPPPTATATSTPSPSLTPTATRTGIAFFPFTVTAETRPN